MGEPEAKKRPKPAETLAPMAKRKKGHLPPPPEPPRMMEQKLLANHMSHLFLRHRKFQNL